MFSLLNWMRKKEVKKEIYSLPMTRANYEELEKRVNEIYAKQYKKQREDWGKERDKKVKKINKSFRRMNRQRIIYNLKKKSKVFSFLYNVAPMFLLICFWLLLFNFFGFFDYIYNLTDRTF